MNLSNVILDYEKQIVYGDIMELTLEEGKFYKCLGDNAVLHIVSFVGRNVRISTIEREGAKYVLRQGLASLSYVKSRIVWGGHFTVTENALLSMPNRYNVPYDPLSSGFEFSPSDILELSNSPSLVTDEDNLVGDIEECISPETHVYDISPRIIDNAPGMSSEGYIADVHDYPPIVDNSVPSDEPVERLIAETELSDEFMRVGDDAHTEEIVSPYYVISTPSGISSVTESSNSERCATMGVYSVSIMNDPIPRVDIVSAVSSNESSPTNVIIHEQDDVYDEGAVTIESESSYIASPMGPWGVDNMAISMREVIDREERDAFDTCSMDIPPDDRDPMNIQGAIRAMINNQVGYRRRTRDTDRENE